MKILLVYGTFPPFQDGGGSYCYELYSYLTSQGHDTHVLTSSFIGNKHELELEHNGKVHLLVDRWDLKGVFGSDRVKVKNFLQKNMFLFAKCNVFWQNLRFLPKRRPEGV